MSPSAQVDGTVNVSQTFEVIELSEQTVIEQIVNRLRSNYPTVSESTVATVVHDVHARYEGRPLRDFVPLFVERNAKSALDELGVMAG
jgi:hypothetical protein